MYYVTFFCYLPGVLSILSAATNDLVLLINNLDPRHGYELSAQTTESARIRYQPTRRSQPESQKSLQENWHLCGLTSNLGDTMAANHHRVILAVPPLQTVVLFSKTRTRHMRLSLVNRLHRGLPSLLQFFQPKGEQTCTARPGEDHVSV